MLPTLRPDSTQRSMSTSMPGAAVRSRSRPVDAEAPRLRATISARWSGASTFCRWPHERRCSATTFCPSSNLTTRSSAASVSVSSA